MKYKYLTIVIFSLLLVSCNVSKTSDTVEDEAQNMIANGYKIGTIVYSEQKGDCDYTIKLEGENTYLLDPIDLADKFKKDAMKVWVTYRGLRMKNRCKKANPIEIIDIKKRAN